MKKLFAVLGVLLFIGSAAAQEVKWFEGSFDEAKQTALKENKIILINYFSGSG
ncbi:hypothetical protein JXO52_03355 [bacterium]|nr:hypothetical protein [bacterium]